MASLLMIAIFFSTAVAVPPRVLGRLLGVATGTGSIGFAQATYRPG
jgi:hypothetical protein